MSAGKWWGPPSERDQRHAALLADWFRLKTAISQAQSARTLRRLQAQIAEVDQQLADLEAQRGNEAHADR